MTESGSAVLVTATLALGPIAFDFLSERYLEREREELVSNWNSTLRIVLGRLDSVDRNMIVDETKSLSERLHFRLTWQVLFLSSVGPLVVLLRSTFETEYGNHSFLQYVRFPLLVASLAMTLFLIVKGKQYYNSENAGFVFAVNTEGEQTPGAIEQKDQAVRRANRMRKIGLCFPFLPVLEAVLLCFKA